MIAANDWHAQSQRVAIAALAQYPERIDVRSPAEFALDHIPGAINAPVLDDAERAQVGTLYATSPFAARRLGAAIVARRVGAMLETLFADRPRDWTPLVYCWRGGQRSRALAHVLNEVGWRAMQLDGGYRSWRRHVAVQLTIRPAAFDFVVICGLTGSGKSRLLAALAAAGVQTLDLEGLARHRGSLLGGWPDAPQPSQKAFESGLYCALEQLDPARPVFVESESRRVGVVQLPDALLAGMRSGRALTLRTSLARRVALLKEEYGHFISAAAELDDRLLPLAPLHGKVTLAHWSRLAAAAAWDALVGELLERHYDPAYTRSLGANFPAARDGMTIDVHDASGAGFSALACEVRASIDAQTRGASI
ncbi:MAG: tRNA 2-selenouridine(34) synthase MnmH [Casimicrobiaceae bacterium]